MCTRELQKAQFLVTAGARDRGLSGEGTDVQRRLRAIEQVQSCVAMSTSDFALSAFERENSFAFTQVSPHWAATALHESEKQREDRDHRDATRIRGASSG